jgi:HEPN domain-containing protein
MVERSEDWLRSAGHDLEMAESLSRNGFYDGACFFALQSAEKAIKALYQKLGGLGWGHSIYKLLEELPEQVRPNDEFIGRVKDLDYNYISSRYPNAFDHGASMDFYKEKDAQKSIALAREVLNFCAGKISEQG